MDDSAYLSLACQAVKAANGSEDERVHKLMGQILAEFPPELLPTLLLRYDALLSREDELQGEIERMEDAQTIRFHQEAS